MKGTALTLCLSRHYCVSGARAAFFSVWSSFVGACSASALRGADWDGANWCCPWCYHHRSYFSRSLLSCSRLRLPVSAPSFVPPHLFLAQRVPSIVLTLLVRATMQIELPSNHLVRAEPVCATDYKPLTATPDSIPPPESSGAFFLIFFFFYTCLISCQLNVYQEADLSSLQIKGSSFVAFPEVQWGFSLRSNLVTQCGCRRGGGVCHRQSSSAMQFWLTTFLHHLLPLSWTALWTQLLYFLFSGSGWGAVLSWTSRSFGWSASTLEIKKKKSLHTAVLEGGARTRRLTPSCSVCVDCSSRGSELKLSRQARNSIPCKSLSTALTICAWRCTESRRKLLFILAINLPHFYCSNDSITKLNPLTPLFCFPLLPHSAQSDSNVSDSAFRHALSLFALCPEEVHVWTQISEWEPLAYLLTSSAWPPGVKST